MPPLFTNPEKSGVQSVTHMQPKSEGVETITVTLFVRHLDAQKQILGTISKVVWCRGIEDEESIYPQSIGLLLGGSYLRRRYHHLIDSGNVDFKISIKYSVEIPIRQLKI